jgi:DNA-binding NarL/FixJ family response regulator
VSVVATPTINVLIVDDHRVFAEALATALDLEPDITVGGMAGSVAEAVNAVERNRPDVALLDYQLPDGTGTEVCRAILTQSPETRAVFLTQFAEIAVLVEAVEAGASAFLAKTSTMAEVVKAVRQAREGETLLSATMLQTLLVHLQKARGPTAPDAAASVEPLTLRELDVLALLARGYSNARVAEELVLSPNTVRTHVQNILRKLGVRSKLAAVSLALQLGLVRVPQ